MVYLLAFWPALMTDDSVDQWSQVLTGRLTGHHPPFHTMLNWLVTRLWLSPATVALAQILALALTFGLTMNELLRWNISPRIFAILTVVFAVSPPNSMMVITLWKDIGYSVALLGFFVALLRAVRTRGRWLSTATGVLTLACLGSLISLLRHNGLFVVVLMFGGLLVAFRAYRRPLALSATAIVAVVFLVRGPLEMALGVPPTSRYYLLANQTHQLPRCSNGAVELTPSQAALLTAVMPAREMEVHLRLLQRDTNHGCG